MMRIALYARVSSTRQQQTHTIDQQLTRLRTYCTTHPDWSLAEEHIFCDDGASGASLKRPGLDHLRDQAAQAAFDLVLLTTPDRLARNYVHQMVLLEELERAGCQVAFLDRPMSNDPHDQLLLQIRGAVAEYERTLIAERMRRGRLTKLRQGQLVPWTRPPYGYRGHPDHPRDPRLVQVDAVAAALILEIAQRYADGGISLYALASELSARAIASPTGKPHWSAATVREILRNPCYTGMAYAQRYQRGAARRRRSALLPVGPGTTHTLAPATQWIGIPVPAILSQALFDRVQARLATNQSMAKRSTRHAYLLRSLVSCGHCRLQCMGRTCPSGHVYYQCGGKQSAVRSGRETRCRSRLLPADQLEQLVWEDLCAVVTQPEQLIMALERAQSGAWLPEELRHRQEAIQRALRSLDGQRERLLAAYLAGVIELAEFERRQREFVQQREDLQAQARQVAHYCGQLQQVQETIPTVQALCARLQIGLAQATFEQRRQLIELLIDCVVVTDEHVEIRYVIPLTEASSHIRFCHLRKDYFQ